jgi:hypothetical protein
MLLTAVPGYALDDVDETTEAAQTEVIEGPSIDSGFVIFKGEYLPPPYVLARRGDDLLINGRVVPSEPFARRSREPGMGREGRFGERGPRREDGPAMMFRRIERQLNENALLIVVDDEFAGFRDEWSATYILRVLLSDAPTQEKVESLLSEGVEWIGSAQWRDIVETFKPAPGLFERIRSLAEQQERIEAQNTAASDHFMSGAIFRSKAVTYGLTVLAMGLAVIAVGTLLNHRPNTNAPWREFDTAGDGVPMVMRNVILLAALGLFDLVLTLVAQQAGGFFEMNPLGGKLLANPVLLAVFKVTSLLIACAILVVLRRYRGAQLASWWLCLIATFLAFRWLTYNSLFLT